VDPWTGHLRRAEARYRDGSARLPDEPDARQRQLTRTGNAAYRDEYLEDIPVGDTVLVLQALTGRRAMAAELSSPLLPS